MATSIRLLLLVAYGACIGGAERMGRVQAGFPVGKIAKVAPAVMAAMSHHPDFNGEWHMTRHENYKPFMKTIGYGPLLRNAAAHAKITQKIQHDGDKFHVHHDSFPAMVPARSASFHIGGPAVPMVDDGGRDMVMSEPHWVGDTLTATLTYSDPEHHLEIQRFMEDDEMVEAVRHKGTGVEMRRIYKKAP